VQSEPAGSPTVFNVRLSTVLLLIAVGALTFGYLIGAMSVTRLNTQTRSDQLITVLLIAIFPLTALAGALAATVDLVIRRTAQTYVEVAVAIALIVVLLSMEGL
jgi:hypothetical protein